MNVSNSTLADEFSRERPGDSGETEIQLWQGGFSGLSMIGSWIAAAIASLLIPVMILFIEPMRANTTVWLTGATLLIAIWLCLLGTTLYRICSQHYIVTSQRIKHRDGILLRKIDRIELIDIDDVTYRQGIVQAMLGVGDININSSDKSHPELTMRGIVRVSHVADMIDDARRAERRKRSMDIEAV